MNNLGKKAAYFTIISLLSMAVVGAAVDSNQILYLKGGNSDTNASTACTGDNVYLSGDGNCNTIITGSNPFNQSLNTTDDVEFDSVTVDDLIGTTTAPGGNHVLVRSHLLPNGLSAYDIGDPSHQWRRNYVSSMYTNYLAPISGSKINIYSDFVAGSPSGDWSFGSAARPLLNIYADGVLGNGTHSADINNIISVANNPPSGGENLWWNDSNIATYNGSASVRGNLTAETINGTGLNIRGASTLGYEIRPKSLNALNNGSTAMGYGDNYRLYFPGIIDINASCFINSTGLGSTAIGRCYAAAGTTRNIIASGNGALAGGYSKTGDIEASGDGALSWGVGYAVNEHEGGFNVGSQNKLNGSKTAGVAIGAANYVWVSYGYAIGFANKVNEHATFGSGAIGSSNYVKGQYSTAVGYGNTIEDGDNVGSIFGTRLKSKGDTGFTYVGYSLPASGKESSIYMHDNDINITGNITMMTGIPSTGGNAGTQICIDANNMLCVCGSCA